MNGCQKKKNREEEEGWQGLVVLSFMCPFFSLGMHHPLIPAFASVCSFPDRQWADYCNANIVPPPPLCVPRLFCEQ